jgi:hypothetical protein
MTEGYIYCFSNISMPGILKIGMTERTPEIRLREANASDTWRPPTPYKIEFAKKVKNAIEKEKTLHILLEQYTFRINPRREFFNVSIEEVLKFFDLMDGEIWNNIKNNENNNDNDNDNYEDEIENNIDCSYEFKNSNIKGCRDMKKCFTDGQLIKHTIGINKTWIGTYNSKSNGILYDEKILTLNQFVVLHYKTERPDRTSNANAWKECYCEIDGKWISTYSLPNIEL